MCKHPNNILISKIMGLVVNLVFIINTVMLGWVGVELGVLVAWDGGCWWVPECGLHSFSPGCYQPLLLTFLLLPIVSPALCN